MKRRKLFFCKELDNYMEAYPLSYLISRMRVCNWSEIHVSEALIEYKTDYFFCKILGEVGIKSESRCGVNCGYYTPRNGKNGCCMYRGFCYFDGKEFIVKVSGKRGVSIVEKEKSINV